MVKESRRGRGRPKLPEEEKKEKRPTKNMTMDKDVVQFFQEGFPTMASKIVNSLSREFMNEILRRESRGFAMEIIDGNFHLCEGKREDN